MTKPKKKTKRKVGNINIRYTYPSKTRIIHKIYFDGYILYNSQNKNKRLVSIEPLDWEPVDWAGWNVEKVYLLLGNGSAVYV